MYDFQIVERTVFDVVEHIDGVEPMIYDTLTSAEAAEAYKKQLQIEFELGDRVAELLSGLDSTPAATRKAVQTWMDSN